MILFPKGSKRRAFIEAVSRETGWVFFGDDRMLSTHLGNLLKDGTAKPHHYLAVAFIDAITFEAGHCFKNAGKL